MKSSKIFIQIIKTLVLPICFLTSSIDSSAMAAHPDIILKKEVQKTFVVFVNYPEKDDFTLTLKDISGTILWEEQVKQKVHYSRRINLKNIPNGVYHLEIEDEESLVLCLIKIIQNELVIEKDKQVIFKPEINQMESLVTFSIPKTGSKKTEIAIINQDLNLLYSEVIDVPKSVNKSFDFSSVDPGQYILQTTIDGRLFATTFNFQNK